MSSKCLLYPRKNWSNSNIQYWEHFPILTFCEIKKDKSLTIEIIARVDEKERAASDLMSTVKEKIKYVVII